MKVVAFIPIKLNSVRLKNKNILTIAGHPLCWHITSTLLEINEIDEIYVYCSDSRIVQYLPQGITFLKRDSSLDGDTVKGAEIYKAFISTVNADVYVLAHATSPFIKAKTIRNSLKKILYESYDSAYSAKKVQNFAWFNDSPLNYSLNDVPRTQDLDPVWIETSAFFMFTRDLFVNTNRRIGFNPYCQEVKGIEALDIDTEEDFLLATAYASLYKYEE